MVDVGMQADWIFAASSPVPLSHVQLSLPVLVDTFSE